MSDDVSDIVDYYSSDPEREHLRLDRHQLEHDLTWRYLNQYLPTQGSILEIGAATGRYTLELAKQGHEITAVDMSPELIEVGRKNIKNAGLAKQVRFVENDARDLRQVVEKDFDAVLLMGPLYHLIAETDRKLALKEAFDRLRQGGIIFTSFISRFGILGDLMRNIPEWIEDQKKVRAMLATGKRPDGYPPGGFRGYFVKVSEIAPLHEEIGFQTINLAGVEPAISADDDSYNKLEGKQRRLWLDLLYELSTEMSVIGASRHILYIGEKM